MARLDNWLSVEVTHALGWALIHSLWQCVGLAALAAALMAFSRRPSVRYLIATGALIAMLAVPLTTFVILLEPAPLVPAFLPLHPGLKFFAVRSLTNLPKATPVKTGAAHIAKDKAKDKGTWVARHAFAAHFPSRVLLSPANLLLLVQAWLCGVALFSLRFIGAVLFLQQECRGKSATLSPRILAICQELERGLGLRRAIRYVECGWLQGPAVIGWIRPIVLLPIMALTGLSEVQLRALIAHELAHIRRLDALVNLFQHLAETLLFYHPAIWWLNRRIRAERELACDEIAISLTGDRLEYARALTLVAKWASVTTLAMAAGRGPLSKRISHILGKKPFGTGSRMLGLIGSILFLAAASGAADALLGVAYPGPMAHAKAGFKTAMSSSKVTMKHVAQHVFQAAQLAANSASFGQSGKETARPIEADQTMAKARKVETLKLHPFRISLPLTTQSALLTAPVALNLPTVLPAAPAPGADPSQVAASNGAVLETKTDEIELPAGPPDCATPKIAGEAIALKAVPGSDLMTVPVEINGTPKQFLLDIGTNPDEVSAPAVAELHLPEFDQTVASNAMTDLNSPIGFQAAVFDVKGPGTALDYQPRVRIGAFTIAGATVQHAVLLVADDREMGKSEPYDGRLTGSLFPQYDIDFDFGGKWLAFFDPTSCTDPNLVAYWPHKAVAVIPMTIANGKMSVPVRINGHVFNAVLDTGSAQTVMRRDIAEQVLDLKADTPDMMPEGDLKDGMGMQVYRHTFPQIVFEGVVAQDVPVLIEVNSMVRKINRAPILGSRAQFSAAPSERIPDLALGMDVLQQLHLYAAFDESKLYVTAAK
jgi:beta-lactamase regulating signal transducer with metallopeptidase domain